MSKRLTHEDYLNRLPKDIDIKPLEQLTHLKGEFTWKCGKGHVFKQMLRNMIRNPRCPECRPVKIGKTSLDDAKKIYQEAGFTFDDGDYVNNKHLHNVTCTNCGTSQTKKLNAVVSGHGCKYCKLNTVEDLHLAASGRGFTVLSVPDDFVGKSTVTLQCPEGHIFEPVANNFIRGSGCTVCTNRVPFTTEVVNDYLDKVGANVVLTEEYINNSEVQTYRCKVCDECFDGQYKFVRDFRRRCPSCFPWIRGYRDFPDIPHKLYYVKFTTPSGIFYKIGVTSHKIKHRFKEDTAHFDITVLRTLEFDTGQKAFDLEQYYLRLFHEHRYQGPPILKSGGNTELFYTDVLGLDKSNQDTQTKAS